MKWEIALGILKSKWLSEEGPDDDVVISTRIRLARNLEGIPFPFVFNEKHSEDVLKRLSELVDRTKGGPLCLSLRKISELSEIERKILVEKHLISPNHANNSKGAVISNEEESLSVMVNEEDHLRIQCIFPGFNLSNAWEYANQIDNLFEESLNYAFSEERGFLTCCPTNVGTGLRASVMVHLPGLVMTNQVSRVLSAISQLGLTVRGLYGEGTNSAGNIFQISNQITLGQSEEEIISNLNSVIEQIMSKERLAREKVYSYNKILIEDRVFRSLGTIKYARLLKDEESLKILSNLRLGVSLNILKEISLGTLKKLMVATRPAMLLLLLNGEETNEIPIEAFRANICREVINL